MIGTIGFLVQETSNRQRWLLSAGLYTGACITTATLLGMLLGVAGQFIRGFVGITLPLPGAILIGMVAIAYAASDVGLVRLPRPTLSYAVPVTWWRRWQPYGAALAYGALLLGTYGAARALVMFPASWGVYCHRAAATEWLTGPLFNQWRAQRIVAVALIIFGAQAVIATILAA